MKRRMLEAVNRALAAKRAAALVTDLTTGLQSLVHDDAVEGDFGFEDELLAKVREAMRLDRSGTIDFYDVEYFIQVLNPPLRLILVGAVHIAQALAPMAALAGYDVTVVDPRRAFATDTRFPGIVLNGDWPDDALKALAPDRRTAVVTLTHDPKLDDPALLAALSSPAFYVGALGSRKTHAKRRDRLAEAGVDAIAFARIRGPVGLDIGAVTPAEIAVSILADMTSALRGGPKAKDA